MAPFDVDEACSRLRVIAIPAIPAPKIDESPLETVASAGIAGIAGIATPQENITEETRMDAASSDSIGEEISLSSLAIQMEYVTESTHCISALNELGKASLISVDIETAKKDENSRSGLDPYKSWIRLVQLYGGKDTVYVFDCFKEGVRSVLLSSKIWSLPMVAHNAIFELKHLKNIGVEVPNIGCTMLQSNALKGGLPKLASLVKEYLHKALSKEQQLSDWAAGSLSKNQLEYAALDAVVTHQIAHLQAEKLKQLNLKHVYLSMKKAQASIAGMELNGFLFDLDNHRILVDRWKKEKAVAQEELSKVLTGINLNSGKQVANWLNGNLDKDIMGNWPRTPTGQLKTDIATFSQYSDLEVTRPLLIYKELSKKLSTYGEKYRTHINSITGRVHGNYRLGGNVTGRLPCSNPNLQQVPRDPDFRSLFVAPPGKLLLVADYSQIQLRIAALLSKDKNMLMAFNEGVDLHSQTAAAILAIPATKITKSQRQIGKAVSFGLLFGQGACGLARYAKSAYGVDMSEQEATEARAIFFKTYPDLAKWQRLTGRRAKLRMRIETPGGRVRDFNREKTGYKFTEALNTPIQGAEAEVLMNTLRLLPKRINKFDIKLVNIIHDELVFEMGEELCDEAREIVEQVMTDGFLMSFPEASEMTKDLVEACVGHNWYEAK